MHHKIVAMHFLGLAILLVAVQSMAQPLNLDRCLTMSEPRLPLPKQIELMHPLVNFFVELEALNTIPFGEGQIEYVKSQKLKRIYLSSHGRNKDGVIGPAMGEVAINFDTSGRVVSPLGPTQYDAAATRWGNRELNNLRFGTITFDQNCRAITQDEGTPPNHTHYSVRKDEGNSVQVAYRGSDGLTVHTVDYGANRFPVGKSQLRSSTADSADKIRASDFSHDGTTFIERYTSPKYGYGASWYKRYGELITEYCFRGCSKPDDGNIVILRSDTGKIIGYKKLSYDGKHITIGKAYSNGRLESIRAENGSLLGGVPLSFVYVPGSSTVLRLQSTNSVFILNWAKREYYD